MTESNHGEALREGLGERFEGRGDVSVTVEPDGRSRLSASDRTVVVERRSGPDGSPRWTLALRADGETVSKFGPLASPATVLDRAETLLETEVRYTVCCDG